LHDFEPAFYLSSASLKKKTQHLKIAFKMRLGTNLFINLLDKWN